MKHIYATVVADMIKGYGVEDVAVRNKLPVADVRRVVENIRNAGYIQNLIDQQFRQHPLRGGRS